MNQKFKRMDEFEWELALECVDKAILKYNQMELQTLLINFAQRNGFSYEEVLTKANRIIDGGWNEFTGYGVRIEGGNAQERQESLQKELERILA